KEGQVLATALQVEQGDDLLLPLNENVRIDETISDTIVGARDLDTYIFTSGKRLGFTVPTEITLRYAIDPRTLADERCGVTRCTTCDYLIHLVIHNVDDPEGTLDVPVRIPATACNELEGFDTLITVTLDPGTYIFERKVESNT